MNAPKECIDSFYLCLSSPLDTLLPAPLMLTLTFLHRLSSTYRINSKLFRVHSTRVFSTNTFIMAPKVLVVLISKDAMSKKPTSQLSEAEKKQAQPTGWYLVSRSDIPFSPLMALIVQDTDQP